MIPHYLQSDLHSVVTKSSKDAISPNTIFFLVPKCVLGEDLPVFGYITEKEEEKVDNNF